MISDQINPPAEPEEDSQPANQTNDVTQPAELMPEATVTEPEAETPAPELSAAPEAETTPELEQTDEAVANEAPANDAEANVSEPTEEAVAETSIESNEHSAEAEAPQSEEESAPQSEAAVETASSVAEEPKAEDAAPRPAKADKRRAKRKVATARDIRDIVEAFAACFRCGYFLSDYRMLFGEQHFSEVVGDREDDWLQMSWSHEMRKTVEKSFGIRIDNNIDYFQGCCDNCRRNFVFSSLEGQEEMMRVQIRLLVEQPNQSRRRR